MRHVVRVPRSTARTRGRTVPCAEVRYLLGTVFGQTCFRNLIFLSALHESPVPANSIMACFPCSYVPGLIKSRHFPGVFAINPSPQPPSLIRFKFKHVNDVEKLPACRHDSCLCYRETCRRFSIPNRMAILPRGEARQNRISTTFCGNRILQRQRPGQR